MPTITNHMVKNGRCHNCLWCGERLTTSGIACPVSLEMRDALLAFAGTHGRNWKSKLLDLWTSGKDEDELRQLRNVVGPTKLLKFQVVALERHQQYRDREPIPPSKRFSSNFLTFEAQLASKADARLVINYLMNRSQWFEVMPCPDDHWAITVKAENRAMVENYMNEIAEERELALTYRQAAIDSWDVEGECEIEENAIVSISPDKTDDKHEDGAYVEAWVWVPRADLGLVEDEDGEDEAGPECPDIPDVSFGCSTAAKMTMQSAGTPLDELAEAASRIHRDDPVSVRDNFADPVTHSRVYWRGKPTDRKPFLAK